MPDPIVDAPAAPHREEPTVSMTRSNLQILHSAGRALLETLLQVPNPPIELVLTMEVLDQAIDEGHAVLETQRTSADEYIRVFGGVTRTQVHNLTKFLEQEGLSHNDL